MLYVVSAAAAELVIVGGVVDIAVLAPEDVRPDAVVVVLVAIGVLTIIIIAPWEMLKMRFIQPNLLGFLIPRAVILMRMRAAACIYLLVFACSTEVVRCLNECLLDGRASE